MTFRPWRILVFGFWIFMCLGFRTFDDKKTFNVNNTSPAKTKIFVDYDQPSFALQNDLPAGDPLAGTATVTIQAVMNSVFNDYNSIAAAYVQLVDTSDTDFAAESTNRIIRIHKAGTDGLSGGEASLDYDGSKVVGCKIGIKPDLYDKAKYFTMAVTHEIGHCLGLDHPQDTTNAVMSYFTNYENPRLQIDDKMGIVYLYPTNPSKAAERATFGMACSRR
jgi:hypothetical protein